MCGIVGYTGKKQASQYLLRGLEVLEYRGYDSAGIAVIDSQGKVQLAKTVGRVEALQQKEKQSPLTGHVGIGHTRWATHGAPLEKNAHPHHDSSKKFYVIHNGIIENYQQLKEKLKKSGYSFYSDTDTEVIPNLIAHHYKKLKNVKAAFQKTLQELSGAYALCMVSTYEPKKVYVAKVSSPLVLGIAEDGIYIASDPTALIEHTKRVVFLDDFEAGEITDEYYELFGIKDAKLRTKEPEEFEYNAETAELGDFPHFMLKEIHEAPQTIRSAMLGRLRVEQNIVKLGGLELVEQQLRQAERIIIVACGTSYYAGLVGEYLLEDFAGIPVDVELASEFKYRETPITKNTVVMAISQSGETADTIAALKKVEGHGVLRIGAVNAVGSTIARMTDAGVYCHAGPEKSVASTKAFIAQVTVLTLIALFLNDGKSPEYRKILLELDELPKKIEQMLMDSTKIKDVAKRYSLYRDFLFIGRRYSYPVALEGSLKLKELSYIHAEAYAAGEMKHGPLAMIDENFPSFALAPKNQMHEKMISNIQEIKARDGPVIALCTEGDTSLKDIVDDVLFVPDVPELLQPIVNAIPLQLFAYYTAVALSKDIDRPRNLAKSVTVE